MRTNMKRTRTQRARATRVVKIRRLNSGEWKLTFNSTYDSLSKRFPLLSQGRWCLSHSEAMRKHNLRWRR